MFGNCRHICWHICIFYQTHKAKLKMQKRHNHDQTLNDYWLPENRLVENKYVTIPFPFQQISSPEFLYEKMMNLNDLIGYLNTWSATQRFINKNKFNPTEQLEEDLANVWENIESEKKLT